MSRIVKCICDGCGKDITADPIMIFAEKVDQETGDFTTEGAAGYYAPGKDFCENCMQQIIHFINGLPARNAGKPAVPNAEFEQAVQQMIQETAKKEDEKEPMQPKIQKLLEEGKTLDEIVELTGCKKQAVYVARNILKKKSRCQEAQVEVKKYKCSEVQKSCAYSTKVGTEVICDFMGKAGHSRGCSAEECTEYQKKLNNRL